MVAFLGKGVDCAAAAGFGIKGFPGAGAVTTGGIIFLMDDLFFLLVFVLIVIY
jgi:hypothetical protein